MNCLRILAISAIATTAAVAHASTVAIDFRSYGVGTAVTSAQGISFSLGGAGATSGAPVIDGWGNNGLSNSNSGDYPTADDLVITFNGNASDVSFGFDNYGGGNGSGWTAYGAGGSVLGTGDLSDVNNSMVSLGSLSGVQQLVLDNGNYSQYGSSWLFDVSSVSATVSAVPEPASIALMMAGLAAVGVARRRRV